MKITILSGYPLNGIVDTAIPGDKSISHRAALFAAIANGESKIENFQVSGVTRPMLKALEELGVEWQLEGTCLRVQGKGLKGLKTPQKALDCGNSATTLRLIAGVLAAAGIGAELTGTPALCQRPMGRIVDPLQMMGVPIHSSPTGTAPLCLERRASGTCLNTLDYSLPFASAQVKSCLLLAALGTSGTTRLREPGPSRDHTERLLASMGLGIATQRENTIDESYFTVEITHSNPLCLPPLDIRIPGDLSAAAFLIVAAIITPNSHLSLKRVGLNPTRTGLIEVLKSMGANISIQNLHLESGETVGDLTVEYSQLCGTTVEGELVIRMIDEFPIFAIAAAQASGKSIVRNASELRLKESDRISKLAGELRKLGVDITEQSDGFTIAGGSIGGGFCQSHKDHRLGMSWIIAGLVAKSPIIVEDAECYTESFPGFIDVLADLGACLQVEE